MLPYDLRVCRIIGIHNVFARTCEWKSFWRDARRNQRLFKGIVPMWKNLVNVSPFRILEKGKLFLFSVLWHNLLFHVSACYTFLNSSTSQINKCRLILKIKLMGMDVHRFINVMWLMSVCHDCSYFCSNKLCYVMRIFLTPTIHKELSKTISIFHWFEFAVC